jgi:hypothetical protein
MEITETLGMVVHKLPAISPVGSTVPVIIVQNDILASHVHHNNAQQLQCHHSQANPKKHKLMVPEDSCNNLP